jgi:hypothetical protein
MATTKIETVFTAQDRASAVMRQLGAAGDRLQSTFDNMAAPLLRAQTLWASLAGGAIIGGIRSLVSAIDDLDEAAQGLGTTAVDLAAIRQAGTEAGVGADKLSTALTRLNVNISEAAAGDAKAATMFGAFGNAALSAAVKAGDSSRVLRELADEFAKLGDGPAKSALAVDLFGKAGAAMIPLLNGGSAALDRFTGLTDETVKAAQRLQNEIDKLGAAWDRFKYRTASVAIPAVNNLLDAVARLKEADFAADRIVLQGSPAAVIKQGVIELSKAYNSASKAADLRNRSIEEGAKLSGAEVVEANRGAQAIRDKAAADFAAAEAAKKKAKAISESSNAYAKEFADVQRIRNARKAFEDDQEAARVARQEADAALVDQMTGRQGEAELQRRIELLNKLKSGEIAASREEIAIAEASIFGVTQGVNNELEKQTELAEQLGLQISSSLGELITTGGKASDVFKALGQDILKMITQLLILKPLADEIGKAFKSIGSGSSGGSSGSSFWSGLLGIGSAAAAGAGGTGQNLNGSWGFVGAAPRASAAGSVIVNNYIDGATDRARISMYVEQGVKAGIAASVDSTARGGSGVIG